MSWIFCWSWVQDPGRVHEMKVGAFRNDIVVLHRLPPVELAVQQLLTEVDGRRGDDNHVKPRRDEDRLPHPRIELHDCLMFARLSVRPARTHRDSLVWQWRFVYPRSVYLSVVTRRSSPVEHNLQPACLRPASSASRSERLLVCVDLMPRRHLEK